MSEGREWDASELWDELDRLFPGESASVTGINLFGPYVLKVGGYRVQAQHKQHLLGELRRAIEADCG